MKATIEIVKVRVSDLEEDDVINWDVARDWGHAWRRVLAAVDAGMVNPQQLQATLCGSPLDLATEQSWLFTYTTEERAWRASSGDWYVVVEHPLEDGSGIDWDLAVMSEFSFIEAQRRIEK